MNIDINSLSNKSTVQSQKHITHKLDNQDEVFFYEQEFCVLSNFSAFTLEWKGLRFDTSEAAYHWEKFTDGHASIQLAILNAPSAHEAFQIAQKFKHLIKPDWDKIKVSVMKNILKEKARQHEYVMRKLMQTGDRILIEDSWRDGFWGWGADQDGKNQLGKLWMEIREQFKKSRDFKKDKC